MSTLFKTKRNRCKHRQLGAATSIDFMLTFPLFATLLLFMIQMGLVLHAYTVINYSAYKAARSARVQILDGDHAFLAMQLPDFLEAAKSIPNGLKLVDGLLGGDFSGINAEAMQAVKASAMNQLVAISPARERYAYAAPGAGWDESSFRMYIDAAGEQYQSRTDPIIRKARYAYDESNTEVKFAFIDFKNLDLQDIEDLARIYDTIEKTPIHSLVDIPVTITVRYRYELQIPIGQVFFANDDNRSYGRWMEATVRLM